MKVITLSDGKAETIVDDDVYEWAKNSKWFLSAFRYPQRKREGKNSYLHREILGLTSGDGNKADHINGNTLDNRKDNLRIVGYTENNHNRGFTKGQKFKGVFKRSTTWKTRKGEVRPYKGNNFWFASITVNYRCIHLGVFATPEEAARAYDEAAKKHFGKFARLNFPKS